MSTNPSYWLVFADHPYYVAVQYHPEYISRPLQPSPPYLGLLLAATGKLKNFVKHGHQFSSQMSYTDEFEDDLCESVRGKINMRQNGIIKENGIAKENGIIKENGIPTKNGIIKENGILTNGAMNGFTDSE